jgi:serine/threonine protein kinase
MLQVQEYCDLGTLGGIASSWDMQQECDEQMLERLVLLRDTAQGLEALHANHVVHGDIVSPTGCLGLLHCTCCDRLARTPHAVLSSPFPRGPPGFWGLAVLVRV